MEMETKIKLVIMMESQKEITSEFVLEVYLYLQSDFWNYLCTEAMLYIFWGMEMNSSLKLVSC